MRRAPSPVEIDYLAGLLIGAVADEDPALFGRISRRIARRGAAHEVSVSLAMSVRAVTEQMNGELWREALSIALAGLAADFEKEGGVL